MNRTNINYPHPVLSSLNEDYIDSTFDISIVDDAIEEDNNKAKLKVNYVLDCPGLQELINCGKAKVVVYIESVIAEFRQAFNFNHNETELSVELKKDELNRSLVLRGYIIADENIDSFVLDEHNKKIFGIVPFSLRRGDIMGIATHHYVIPLNSYDPLSNRPSIFRIRKQTERPNEEISADFSQDKIVIYLNADAYDKYQKLYEAPDVRGVLASFFAAPVLVDVLNYIKNMTEEERISAEEKKWYQVIQFRIKELNIDLNSENSLAKLVNLILPHVFVNAVESLTQLCKALLQGESDV